MSDDDDYDRPQRLRRARTVFPIFVTIAGVLWICFGCLGLVGTLMSLAKAGNQPPPPRVGRGNAAYNVGYRAGQTIAPVVGGIIAGVFVWVGTQTVRGKAKDTIGNSIGSMVFGVIYLLVALGVMSRDQLFGIISFAIGFALILSGIFGLMGRRDYLSWRSGGRRRVRPRRTMDDDDEAIEIRER